MAFRRKRREVGSPEVEAARRSIEQGWNGLAWGATVDEFRRRFPGAERTPSDWWVTGQGHETFAGATMLTQYGFNADDRLHLVVFYPDGADRERLPVTLIEQLGPPRGQDLVWPIGEVDVEVKTGGVIVSLTNRRLAAG